MFTMKINFIVLCVLLLSCKEVFPNRIRSGNYAKNKINRAGTLKNFKGRWDSKSYPTIGTLMIVVPCNTSYTQARLDFRTLVLDQPAATSQCTGNRITFSGQSSPAPFTLCGNLTDQHVYLYFNGTENIIINIEDADNIEWDIEITQLLPTDLHYAPETCLQYYITATGSIESFNYETSTTTTRQIASLDYNICIATQQTYCTITYTADGPFSMTTDPGLATSVLIPDNDGTLCTTDFLAIGFDTIYTDTTGAPMGTGNFFCGVAPTDTQFIDSNRVTTSKLFPIRVATNAIETPDAANVGFSFTYTTSAICL